VYCVRPFLRVTFAVPRVPYADSSYAFILRIAFGSCSFFALAAALRAAGYYCLLQFLRSCRAALVAYTLRIFHCLYRTLLTRTHRVTAALAPFGRRTRLVVYQNFITCGLRIRRFCPFRGTLAPPCFKQRAHHYRYARPCRAVTARSILRGNRCCAVAGARTHIRARHVRAVRAFGSAAFCCHACCWRFHRVKFTAALHGCGLAIFDIRVATRLVCGSGSAAVCRTATHPIPFRYQHLRAYRRVLPTFYAPHDNKHAPFALQHACMRHTSAMVAPPPLLYAIWILLRYRTACTATLFRAAAPSRV